MGGERRGFGVEGSEGVCPTVDFGGLKGERSDCSFGERSGKGPIVSKEVLRLGKSSGSVLSVLTVLTGHSLSDLQGRIVSTK